MDRKSNSNENKRNAKLDKNANKNKTYRKSDKNNKIFGVDINIALLGIVSFLTDVSSEAIFSVFSIFFTAVLGGTTALLGIVEGLADFSASSLDYFSGAISDRTGKKKNLTILGYGLSTAAKSLLVFATTVPIAAIFRVVERLGKSIRGPPRDSLISSLSDEKTKGYSFGFHKTLDKAGAILGPLIAYLFFTVYPQTLDMFITFFAFMLIPAILAVLILFLVKEKKTKTTRRESIFEAYKTLSRNYKNYIMIAALFSISYFSFGFLLLKAYEVGFGLNEVILLYSLFNISFVLVSIPIGKLGDRIGREKIILMSYLIYAVMCIGFIVANSKMLVIGLFILYGVFYAIDEGQTKAFITDLEKEKKGTAIGLYNFITGMAYLPASVIAGLLWSMNSAYTFVFAAFISLIAFTAFLIKFIKIR